MNKQEPEPPIIVKRVKKSAAGHHGGSWKIAYADFVTAMMAFFLLMWLVITAGKSQLAGVADYFKTPLTVALEGGSGSGDRTSIIKGGGTDITHTTGQVSHAQVPSHTVTISSKSAERQELARLTSLKGNLESSIARNNFLSQFKHQLLIDVTNAGLRLQLVDNQDRPMFASGSAKLEPYAEKLLQRIGNVLNLVPNKISIAGHTDATPYPDNTAGYSNWDLSADRANACRRAMEEGGLSSDHILRVVGLSSAVPLDAKDPTDPLNRRISILVLNSEAARKIKMMSGGVLVNDKGEIMEPNPAPAETSPISMPPMP